MHPATANIAITAHLRDLERAVRPERKKRPRGRLAWIRKSH